MADIIGELRKEHANIHQLLDVLERQVERTERGVPIDEDIVEAVVDYFQSYPDLYHHPKEDLLYRQLRVRNPQAAMGISDLQEEHETVAARTREFAIAVRALLERGQNPLPDFIDLARNFIDFQRRHMEDEERVFFPTVAAQLTREDWAEVAARMTDHDDPLFGRDVGERYQVLIDDILAWEKEDREA